MLLKSVLRACLKIYSRTSFQRTCVRDEIALGQTQKDKIRIAEKYLAKLLFRTKKNLESMLLNEK